MTMHATVAGARPVRMPLAFRILCHFSGADHQRLASCPLGDKQFAGRIGLQLIVSSAFLFTIFASSLLIGFGEDRVSDAIVIAMAFVTASMPAERIEHLRSFHSILERLEAALGGSKTLGECFGRLPWPQRGVYFFQELGEHRSDSGTGPRIVRVGTHALASGSGTRLWTRLSQHRGQKQSGGGNHRGSIFRLIVGTALIERGEHASPTWGKDNTAPREVRDQEISLECAVSNVIRAMPFLWLGINDEPGPDSLRGYIERNSIALLSNYAKPPLDPPSSGWLGRACNRERVRKSGLWNSNHVDEAYDSAFLDRLDSLVKDMAAGR
jgi:hypothetical protein